MELHGLLGVSALMVLENVLALVPFEMIVPFAGFVAARGDINTAGLIATMTLGSVDGTLPLHVTGNLLDDERLKHRAVG